MKTNLLKDYQLFKDYNATHNQLEQFKKITEDENNEVIVAPNGNSFLGRFFNLYDMGITRFSRGDVDAANRTGKLFRDWGVLYYKVMNRLTVTDSAADFLDCLDDMKANYTNSLSR